MPISLTSSDSGLQEVAARKAVYAGGFLFWWLGWGIALSLSERSLEWYVGWATGLIVWLSWLIGHFLSWRHAAWSLAVLQLCVVTYLGWHTEGEQTNLLLSLTVTVAFCGWILGTRAAVYMATLATAVVAVMAWHGHMKWVQWLGVSYTMTFLVGVIYLAHRRFERQLRKQGEALQELSLRKRELTLLHHAIEQSADSVLIVDLDGHVRYANASFERQSGYARDEVLGKRSIDVSASGLDAKSQTAMRAAMAQGLPWSSIIQARRKDGCIVTESVSISPVHEEGVLTSFVEVKQDVTERVHAQERLSYLQNFDVLTQLPNRYALMAKLEQLLLQSRTQYRRSQHEPSTWHAILQVDLDRFKKFNDARGSAWADALLQALALRLRSVVADDVFVARATGDQFALVVQGAGDSRQASRLKAYALATELQLALDHVEVSYEGSEHVPITCGIGFTVFPFIEPGLKSDAPEHIMRRCSVALNKAKQQGLGKIHSYSEAMAQTAQRNLRLEKDLHAGIQQGQLRLYVQPQVNMFGQVMGLEALVRWQHPEEGLISPGEFIPIAEESGLIVGVGDWVLDQVCSLLARPDVKAAGYGISANISALQLQAADFVAKITQRIQHAGIDARKLVLEVTETLLLTDVDAMIQKMVALQALGVQFAIDDFGTGYSSLAYLMRLPIQEIKMDQSFIRELKPDGPSGAMVQALLMVAKSQNLRVVAEGVEHAEQAQLLQAWEPSLLCQGYFFSKPLPVEQWLQNPHQRFDAAATLP